MAAEDNWESLLNGHPIFSQSRTANKRSPFELSLSSLRDPKHGEGNEDGTAPSGRRQVMCMKDADLILAVGSEIRMTSLGDTKVSGGSQKTYKVLHTPSIEFSISQLSLSPNKKLLAVAGVYQVAVVVLPRSGFSKMVTSRIDCKSLQIGQYYHADSVSPIAKIDWHPWGEAGSTLLVMTVDGKLREYDVSLDPDEPRKTLDFVTQRKRGSYAAVDESEREVASFTFGKGKADWGPLTIYALMKSGDIYAICPYLPENASIPSAYLHALECFVSAKEEFVSENNEAVDESFSTLYDYQRKFVNGLLKQLPPGTPFSSTSRAAPIHTPKSFAGKATRQGPFLLQPAPSELQNSPGGDATDIVYLTLGSAFADEDDEDPDASSLSNERLGVLLVAFQDGRVDVCLDLEKVEARWDAKKPSSSDLPMLAVYEVIDLGLISALSLGSANPNPTAVDLLQHNHTVFHPDPIHDDTVYAYHAFGVHALNLNPIFQNLAAAMKEEDEKTLIETVQTSACTSVQAILSTYSIEQGSSDPVTAVVIPSDVYLTYSIFILTATLRVASFTLNLRTEGPVVPEPAEKRRDISLLPTSPSSTPPAYVSLLSTQPFTCPPALSRPMGFPTIAKLSLPQSHSVKAELRLTPETLRYLGTVSERISGEVHDAVIACHALKNRADLQKQEFERLQKKAVELVTRTRDLTGPRKIQLQETLRKVQDERNRLLGRMDKLLQALIRKASPELNEHETRWFEELQRMKSQVLGVGRYDSDSLKNRVQSLQSGFDRLLPALTDLAKIEAERKARLEEVNGGAGHSYAKAYGRMSKQESVKLEDAMKQLVKLARKLDISSLSPPPL
ncbi:hypothetical protein M0805_003714 [Coniferiporia weirii]|nr:hypothetical protein M0805_003714 [Coniferiporia weirii]